MKLDPLQAEQVWYNLQDNPCKRLRRCDSALQLKNNRSALYRARNRLLKRDPNKFECIRNYEIGKDESGLNILIQPNNVGSDDAAAQLRAQGFAIHTHVPPTPTEAFNTPTPTDIHPVSGLPINLTEPIVETTDMLANLGYGARKIKPDDENNA
jgi:hypothetical protein